MERGPITPHLAEPKAACEGYALISGDTEAALESIRRMLEALFENLPEPLAGMLRTNLLEPEPSFSEIADSYLKRNTKGEKE